MVGLEKECQSQVRNANEKGAGFKADFNDLFGVAHADTLTLIKISEVRVFLVAQREKGRRGCMSSVDKQQQMEQKKSKENRKCKSKSEVDIIEKKVKLESSSSVEESDHKEPLAGCSK